MIERFKKLTVIFGASAMLIASQSICATSIVAYAEDGDSSSSNTVEQQQQDEEVDNKEVDNKEVDNKEVDNKEVDNKEVDNEEVDNEEVDNEEVDKKEDSGDNKEGQQEQEDPTKNMSKEEAELYNKLYATLDKWNDEEIVYSDAKYKYEDLKKAYDNASEDERGEKENELQAAKKEYEDAEKALQAAKEAHEDAKNAYNEYLKKNNPCVTSPSSDSQEEDNDEPEEATPVEASEPEPTIGSSGAGWSSMSDEVNQAIANATKAAMEAIEAGTEVGTDATAVVSVNLNGTDTVPASAISAIAGKDVVLNLSVSTTMSVNINGSSLNASDVGDIKLSSETDSNGTSTLSVRAENSDINKSIDVFYKVGEANIGGNAVLNFVNADGSLVEFRNSIVYDNGYAAFTTPLVSANYKMSLK